MGKFGWGLPPGVRVSDIPGNRPEEIAAENAWELLYEEIEAAGITPEAIRGAVCARAPTRVVLKYGEMLARRQEFANERGESYQFDLVDALDVDADPNDIRHWLIYAEATPRDLTYTWLRRIAEENILRLEEQIGARREYLHWLAWAYESEQRIV